MHFHFFSLEILQCASNRKCYTQLLIKESVRMCLCMRDSPLDGLVFQIFNLSPGEHRQCHRFRLNATSNNLFLCAHFFRSGGKKILIHWISNNNGQTLSSSMGSSMFNKGKYKCISYLLMFIAQKLTSFALLISENKPFSHPNIYMGYAIIK